VLMHDTLRRYKDSQFIISTHSPVLLGYPSAQILSFDSAPLQQIGYEETAPLLIVRYFLNNREDFLKELFQETPSLFDVVTEEDSEVPIRGGGVDSDA